MNERSTFDLMCEQQVVRVVDECGRRISSRARDFFNKMWDRGAGSQMTEDGFNRCKNCAPYQNRRITVMKSYQALIDSKLLSTKHHFNDVEPAPWAACRNAALPESSHRADFRQTPSVFREISNYKDKTAWYSPRADQLPIQWLDLLLRQRALELDDMHLVQFTWLGGLLSKSRQVIFRRKGNGEATTSAWLLPIGVVEGSGVAVLPLLENITDGPDGQIFHYVPDFAKPWATRDMWQFIWDLKQWEAKSVAWKSPAWQHKHYGNLIRDAIRHFDIRAFATSGANPLIEIAAEAAFWSLGHTFLARLAKYTSNFIATDTLFNTLHGLVEHYLQCDESKLLEILGSRLEEGDTLTSRLIDEFLETDVCFMAIDKQDKETLLDTKKEYDKKKQDRKQYKNEWQQKKKSHQAAQAAEGNDGTGRRSRPNRGAGSRANPPLPPRRLPPGDLDQAQLRLLAPPGGYVWKGGVVGSWASHFPPYKRFSASWRLYGHRQSAILVLRSLWIDWADYNCKAREEIPIQGLFDGDGVDILDALV